MTAPEIAEAKLALDQISADERSRQLALDRTLNDAAHKIYVGAAYHSGKSEGLIEGKSEGLIEGEAKGLIEGEAKGLRLAIIAMLDFLGDTMSPVRQEVLEGMGVQELQTFTDRIRRERRWPSDG